MIGIGRLCVKIAGRDAGKKCVIVDTIDKNYVMIDGETRRRKCNTAHLEPLDTVLKIEKNASHEEIKKEFEKLGLKSFETKPKQKTQRPRTKRKTPEQLRAQKEVKKKSREIFKKKAEEKVEKAATELETKIEAIKETEVKAEIAVVKEEKAIEAVQE